MGFGITITCSNCYYRKDFLLGIGMLYPLLSEIIKELNKKARLQVEELIADEKVEGYEYSRALYKCPKCGTLSEKGRLILSLNDGTTYVAPYACYRCKRTFEFIDNLEIIKTLECPQCRSVSLDFVESILWD